MNHSNIDGYRYQRAINPLFIVIIIATCAAAYFMRPSEFDAIIHYYENGYYDEVISYAEKKNLNGINVQKNISKYVAKAYCMIQHDKCYYHLKEINSFDDFIGFDEFEKIFNKIALQCDNHRIDNYADTVLKLAELIPDGEIRSNSFLEREALTFLSKKCYKEALLLYEKAYNNFFLTENGLLKAVETAWTQDDSVKVTWMKRRIDEMNLKSYQSYKSGCSEANNTVNIIYRSQIGDIRNVYENIINSYFGFGRFKNAIDYCIQAYQQFNDDIFLQNCYYMANEKSFDAKEILEILSINYEKFMIARAELENKNGDRYAAIGSYYLTWRKWKNIEALKNAYFIANEYSYTVESKRILIELYENTNDESFYQLLLNLLLKDESISEILAIESKFKTRNHSAYIFKNLAYYYLQNKNYKYSLKYYLKYWDISGDAYALEGAYASAAELKNIEEMERLLKKMYSLKKDNKYLSMLGEIYRDNPEKIEKLLKEFPDNQEWRLLLSIHYMDNGRYSEAEKHLLELTRNNDNDIDIIYRISRLYLDTNQIKKAYPFCKQLYLKNKKYADLYIYAAERIGGEVYFDALQDKWKDDADETTGFKLSEFYLNNKEYAQAIFILEKILKKKDSVDCRLKLGYAYEKDGQIEKKNGLLKDFSLSEMPADIVISLSYMYIKQGNWEKAVNILEQWNKEHSSVNEEMSVLKQLVYIYNRMGKKDLFVNTNKKMEKAILSELKDDDE